MDIRARYSNKPITMGYEDAVRELDRKEISHARELPIIFVCDM